MRELFRVYNNDNRPVTGYLTATQVKHLVAPGEFPPLWSIEWFTGDVSRGMVTFDQVKRFAEGGNLVTPEEVSRKDNITLEQWSQRYSVVVGTHDSGCRYVMDEFPSCNEARTHLFRLTDYIVSSIVAGTIWLVKRQVDLPQGND